MDRIGICGYLLLHHDQNRTLGEKAMKDRIEERAYKSVWHLLIALVGVYEIRNHRTRLSKVLACGLIAFHADAAICDALDVPTTLQRLLRRLRP